MAVAPSEPVTSGIASVHALLAWTPAADPFAIFNRAIVPFAPRNPAAAGGRMLDCSGTDTAPYPPQGTASNTNYTFRWWPYVDVFNFFGGATLFYIPTPGWTNAAHRNGVPCLGTVFVNDAQQVADLVANQAQAISQLVGVTKYYGFDGWFFNVEESTGQTLATQLLDFLRTLTGALHDAIPGSLVIWYDALVSAGYVAYQNELNSQNIAFFNATDGLFTNYWWNLDGAEPSPQVSAQNAQAEGASPLAVYTALDCYGRGSPVSGYQCAVGVKAALQAGTSTGLFSPGWTYQNADTPLNGFAYAEGDAAFWRQIASVLPARVAAWSFPFVTHFDTGQGNQFCVDGAIANAHWYTPWSNMSQQDVLPAWTDAVVAGSAAACRIDPSNACPFDGGSCLRITGDPSQDGFAAYRLYATNLTLGSSPLTVSFTYAPAVTAGTWNLPVAAYPDAAIALVLDNGTALVLLSGAGSPCNGKSAGTGLTPAYLTNGSVTKQRGAGAAATMVTWITVAFDLGTSYSGRTITEIRLLAAWTAATPDQPVPFVDWSALGELKLLAGTPPALPPVTQLTAQNVAWSGSTATLNLFWTAPPATIRHYDVYVRNASGGSTWLGRAFAPGFWVAAATLPSGAASLTFGVRCADVYGQFEPLTSMATVAVPSA